MDVCNSEIVSALRVLYALNDLGTNIRQLKFEYEKSCLQSGLRHSFLLRKPCRVAKQADRVYSTGSYRDSLCAKLIFHVLTQIEIERVHQEKRSEFPPARGQLSSYPADSKGQSQH